MRLLAGVAFPSDIEAGTELGRRVAQAVMEKGRQDGADSLGRAASPRDRAAGAGPILSCRRPPPGRLGCSPRPTSSARRRRRP